MKTQFPAVHFFQYQFRYQQYQNSNNSTELRNSSIQNLNFSNECHSSVTFQDINRYFFLLNRLFSSLECCQCQFFFDYHYEKQLLQESNRLVTIQVRLQFWYKDHKILNFRVFYLIKQIPTVGRKLYSKKSLSTETLLIFG